MFQNGQTVYQTVHIPLAAPDPQQIQFAQILMPDGQIQQIQVVQPQQILNTAGFPGMQQATQIQEKANVTAGSTGT